MEMVTKFISLGSKITVDSDCNCEIQRYLLFRRKAMTNLDSIFKSRDNTLLTNVHTVKAIVFPVVMYGCESRTVNKVEHLRTDAFKLWCWRRLLRVPWPARKLNQSILKEIFPEYSLEGLMLKLKFWYFCHLMQRAISFSVIPFSSRLQSLPANISLFHWVSSLHQVVMVLELHLQHQPFQWIFRVDFL